MYNSAMQSSATIGDARKSAGSFPYYQVMGKGEVMDTDVMIVDVGGGRGQALRAIREAFPNLKGRMILQDKPDMIEDAKASGLPNFIEPMAASFFELQPVKGMKAIYLLLLSTGSSVKALAIPKMRHNEESMRPTYIDRST